MHKVPIDMANKPNTSEIYLAKFNSLLHFTDYIKTLLNYYKTYKNFVEIIKAKATNKFPLEAELRTGKRIYLSNPEVAYSYMIFYNSKLKIFEINDKFITFEFEGHYLKFYGWKFGGIIDAFLFRQYDSLNVKDKVVVDIGANIGDTAIYFALRGARKVIAFEPFPNIFELAKRNVEENGLQDKIVLVNAGCGYDGKVRLRQDTETDTDIQLTGNGSEIEVPVYSLNTIVRMFEVDNAALKVDCEGCEYELFRTATDDTLSKFDQIIIEYHYGYKELVKRLIKARFNVKHSMPKYTKGGMVLGNILAWR